MTDGPTRAVHLAETVIRACQEHGFFDAPRCPTCGAPGRELLGDERRTRLSKFLSGALRHFPADAGIDLDGRGWTAFDDLAAAAVRRYDWADRERVAAVLATDPKGRFERAGDRVRAAYGHSVDVTVGRPADPAEVPDRLYHGTAPRNLDSILSDGLEPMDRRRVHLSSSVDGAREVGRRRADEPALLAVDAEAMLADDRPIEKRGPETFTTGWVPPRYLAVIDGE